MSNEFNTKLLKLDGLLMEYKLADMREKYPDMFHTILGIYTEKDAKIQQLKQQLEESKREMDLIILNNSCDKMLVDKYLELGSVHVKANEDRFKLKNELEVYKEKWNEAMDNYIESRKTIGSLRNELKEAVDVIDVLIQDIDTPSRLGLADKPNENWESLNEARQFLAKYRGEKL